MALLDDKHSYRKTGLRKKRLLNITLDRPFFTMSAQDWKLSLWLARAVGKPLPSGGCLREDIQFI